MQAVGHLAIAVHKSDHTNGADKWQEKYFFVSRHGQFEVFQLRNETLHIFDIEIILQYHIPLVFCIMFFHLSRGQEPHLFFCPCAFSGL